MKKSILFSVFLSLFAISLSSCGNGSNSSSDNKHDNKPTCNHDMTFFKEIEASCVEEGTKAYYQCKNCDGKFWTSDGQLQVLDDKALIINALGHKVKHNEKIEQTCTKDGVDEHYFCIRCEKYFKDENCENEIYDPTSLIHHATGHNLEFIEGTEPTCTEKGSKGYWHCVECDKNYWLIAGDFVLVDENNKDISPLGHKVKYINKVNTTCTTDGVDEHYYCVRCEKYFKDEGCTVEIYDPSTLYHSAAGHNLTHIEGYEATCIKEGKRDYWHCSTCSKNYWLVSGQLSLVDEKDLTISSLGHNLKHHLREEQTCITDGVDEYYYCLRCESYFEDSEGKNLISDPTSLIHHATGHSLEHVEGIDPTCISQGKREYWHCSTCNKNFSLSAGDYEIKDESTLIISPLGHNKIDTVYYDDEKHRNACSRCDIHLDEHEHNYVETSKVTEGSCIEEHKGLFECDGCDKYVVRSVAPTGHNFNEILYDENYHWKECLNCGERFFVVTHNMDGGIVTEQPTCTTKGLKEYHCSDCDYQYQEILPFAEHTSSEYFNDEESHWQTCSECGVQFNLHNHDFSISTMIKEPTFAEEGLKRLTCSQCGYEKEVVLDKTQLIYMINGEGTGYIVLGTNSTQENLELYIPEEYNGLPVVEIGGSAFNGSQNIVSFYSSKNIKKIGKHAFYGCLNLSYIELNEGLKVIDEDAFDNSNLSLVQEDFLPDSIEAINNCAFGWSQLKGIILKNISCLGQSAFAGCQKLTSVTLNPELSDIYYNAFAFCPIIQISIPKNVKNIDSKVFECCYSLLSVEFEDSESKWTDGSDIIDVSDPILNAYLFTRTYCNSHLYKC